MKKNIKLTPFKLCVLQNFPYIEEDFDALTNYGLMCKIVEYLNKTIEQQNISSENVNILINWFNNLDVQDEINNKLDAMAESGELQEIISSYLNSTAIFGFNNIEDMKSANNLINGSYAKTYGYYEKNDGGSGFYKIRNLSNTDVIDNGSIIPLNNENLVAELLFDESVNVKQFGAKGDGITDDSDAIDNAIKFGNKYKIYFPTGNYYIDKPLSLPTYGITLYGESINNVDVNLYLGDNIPFNKSTIISNSSLFVGTNNSNLTCEIYNLIIVNKKNSNTPLFDNISLTGSKIHDNYIFNYKTFIDGVIKTVTRISNNRIYYLKHSFLEGTHNVPNAQVVDSIIEKNEIMGMPGQENYCFINNEFAMSYITENYIEFFSFGYKANTGNDIIGVISDGNVYDYMLQMTPDSYGFTSGSFRHDTFSNFNLTDAQQWQQPIELINTNEFTVFKFKGNASGHLNRGIVIEDCLSFDNTRFANIVNWETTTQCLITINNIRQKNSGQIYNSFPMTFAGNGEDGYANFIINNNLLKKVSSLPDSNNFNGETVIYNGECYYYFNSNWHKYTNPEQPTKINVTAGTNVQVTIDNTYRFGKVVFVSLKLKATDYIPQYTNLVTGLPNSQLDVPVTGGFHIGGNRIVCETAIQNNTEMFITTCYVTNQ